VVEFLAGLPGPTRVGYEAGPTGYGLARALRGAGIACVVGRRGRSSALRRTRSRPMRATRSGCCGC
jgi:transposase